MADLSIRIRRTHGRSPIMPVPSPAAGLAEQYPNDIGIENDPDVLFTEMFEEASIAAMAARWTDSAVTTSVFVNDVPVGSTGGQSLHMIQNRTTLPLSNATLFQNIGGQGTAAVYARAYFKYPTAPARAGHSGIWMGGNAPQLTYPFVPAGTQPPQTDTPENDNWFNAGVEVVDDEGRLDHYNYWPEMHADGGGAYWGNFLLMNPAVKITLDQWFCLECMVKINSPTTAFNGEHAFWFNGVKVSHLGLGFPNGTWNGNRFTQDPGGTPFEGFRWTPATMVFDTLDPNWVWLQAYNGAADCSLFVDHFVVAKRYIGPISS
jgi:hypothetical protein